MIRFDRLDLIADCVDLLDLTTEELSCTLSASSDHNSNQGCLSSDLRTWLSGAFVNQETCIEGFDGTNSFIKSAIAGGLNQISSLILQSLHDDTPLPPPPPSQRKLMNVDDHFPARFSARELQIGGGSADAVVATDGSGDYNKIVDAVASDLELNTRRFVIYVKKGLYKENVEIVGDGMDATIISGNRSFKGGYTTFGTSTFSVKGKGFIGRDITFENTAWPKMDQAVTFRSDSDLSVLYRCCIKGYQDTLYAHSMRQFYRECRISSTMDFIFGKGIVVFQSCQIVATKGKPNQNNTITAQGRTDPTVNSGFLIQFSNLSLESELLMDNNTQTYFGRPWSLYSRTMIMQLYIGPGIRAKGWLDWNVDLTAQGRTNPTVNSGISIQFSNISVESELLMDNKTQTYFGRPWSLYSRTMIMPSYIGPGIRAKGWLDWNEDLSCLNTLWFGEYMNHGEGARLGNRVKCMDFMTSTMVKPRSNFNRCTCFQPMNEIKLLKTCHILIFILLLSDKRVSRFTSLYWTRFDSAPRRQECFGGK